MFLLSLKINEFDLLLVCVANIPPKLCSPDKGVYLERSVYVPVFGALIRDNY